MSSAQRLEACITGRAASVRLCEGMVNLQTHSSAGRWLVNVTYCLFNPGIISRRVCFGICEPKQRVEHFVEPFSCEERGVSGWNQRIEGRRPKSNPAAIGLRIRRLDKRKESLPGTSIAERLPLRFPELPVQLRCRACNDTDSGYRFVGVDL
jgi:hypothetical protein